MRFVLVWVKSNLVLVVAALLCLASIGGLILVTGRGSGFINRVTSRNGQIRAISMLMSTEVKPPPERPDDPPPSFNITVNEAAISALKDVYQQMSKEYSDIYRFAVGINSQGHLPLLDGLFPEPAKSPTKAFDARFAYLAAFKEFFQEYSPSADHPQLDASPPPSEEEIKEVFNRADAEFKAFASTAGLSEEQERRLKEVKAKKLKEFFVAHAKKTHLYSKIDPTEKEFPLPIMAWAYQTNQPDPRDLWEAQLQLWIINDITRAIAQTNRVNEESANVMNVPVKRLLAVDISPDYVGLTGSGAMDDKVSTPSGGRGAAPTPRGNAQFAPPALAPSPAGNTGGKGGNAKLTDDFSLAPSGRRSNEIYDVRHVWISFIADSQRLPEFFDNLAQVSFMTVLKMEITDADEYEAAKQGFIYGPCDAVKVDMLIETLWLRDWTVKLMPLSVKEMLGIVPPPDNARNN